MDSKELNERLSDISDEAKKYGFEAFGGKAIPYIGWYWREVDFDAEDGYSFGIVPEFNFGYERNDSPQVGFMENNKWDYPYVHADAEEWQNIKSLLTAVAENPCAVTLRAANNAIQALSKKRVNAGA